MITEIAEAIVREQGALHIDQLYRIIQTNRVIEIPSFKQLRAAIRASQFLEIDSNGLVYLSPIIHDDDYGEVTQKELAILKKSNCPTLREIAIRKLEISRKRLIN